jgi:hypothetical protein
VHQEWGFATCFPLDVPMVHSSTLTIYTNDERLMCGCYSLDETIHYGSLEFIVDCFGSLSLSPKGSDLDTIFVGMTHSGSPLLWAMIEDFPDEFYKACSGEGCSVLPVSRRHSTGTSPAPIATTPWPKNASTTQTMTTVPPWTLAPRPDIELPPEQWHTFWEGQQARARAQ